MANTAAKDFQVKVHRSICLELKKFIHRITHILLAIESARPNCALAVQALCSLHFTLDKAKLVIQQCSQSSKLYLVIKAHKIVSRCEKIRSDLELYLTQIHEVVPVLLDAKISGILHDLRAAEFSLEFAEDEARKAILELLENDLPVSESINKSELDAVRIATLRLKITSPFTLLVEKGALKMQIDKVNDTNQREKELLKYLLYLLIKYRKFICRIQTGSECHHPSLDDNQQNNSVNPQVGDS